MTTNLLVAVSLLFATQAPEPDAVGGQVPRGGSLPPLMSTSTTTTDVAVRGLYLRAGSFNLGGAFVGYGAPFDLATGPVELAYELSTAAFGGGGGFDLGSDIPAAMGGRELDIRLWSVAVGGNLKLAWRHGDFSILAYSGANFSVGSVGIENAIGRAASGTRSLGLTAGLAPAFCFFKRVKVEVYGGIRDTYVQVDLGEEGLNTNVLSPEFGGDVAVEILPGLDVSLGALFNFLAPDDDDQREMNLVVQLGASWTLGERRGGAKKVDEAPVREVEK